MCSPITYSCKVFSIQIFQYLRQIPPRVCTLVLFILRASLDTLPTPLNLRRWKMRCDSSCVLCKSKSPTVVHILNYCPTALNQKCFSWRHDSVLLKLFSSFKTFIGTDDALYVDLPGECVSETSQSTVPISILATSARPDMVLIRGTF